MPISKSAVDIYNADNNEILIKGGLVDAGYPQSGSLSTTTLSTTVATTLSTTRDVTAYITVTNTSAAGTIAVALSPDNSTFSTVATNTTGANSTVNTLTIRVPAGWFIKATFTNATITTTFA